MRNVRPPADALHQSGREGCHVGAKQKGQGRLQGQAAHEHHYATEEALQPPLHVPTH